MDPFSFNSFGKRQAGQVLIDAVLAGAVWLFTHLVLFGVSPSAGRVETMWTFLPAVVLGKPGINFLMGHYRQLWRYTSLREVVSVHFGAVLAATGLWLADLLSAASLGVPVILMDAAFFMLAAPGVRLFRRVQQRLMQPSTDLLQRGKQSARERVLVVGADEAADALLRDVYRERKEWTVVGLLDDDLGKHGSRLHGVPVLGSTTGMEQVVEEKGVDRVVVGLPRASEAVVRDLVRRARVTGAKVSRLPAPSASLSGSTSNGDTAGSITLHDLKDVTEVQETLLGKVRGNGGEEESPVLVTGGAGYIGSHLVRKLLDAGHNVRVLDSLLYGDQGLREVRDHPKLELIEGDVCNVRDVTTAIRDVDTVIALAAIVGDPACGIDAEATLNLNFESTKILAEACKFYDVDRVVFASTCSVYGAKDDELLTESSSLNPVSLYARTKIMSENLLLERLDHVGATTPVLLRLATVFGLSPRMRFDLVVNTLTARAVVDGKFQVFGGDQWRPFVHCADAAKAFYLAATAPEAKVAREVFNVGSDEMNYQIASVGEMVSDVVPDTTIEHLQEEVDARNYRVSFDKISSVLGFQPDYDLREGIREMASAVREQGQLQDYSNEVFSNVQSLEEQFTRSTRVPS